MEPMTMLALSAGLGAGGQIANFIGGNREARRRRRAIERFENESRAIYDALQRDAWEQGQERQRATGHVVQGLVSTMGAPPSAAPDVNTFLPEVEADPSGIRGDAYRAVLAAAGQPRQTVNQRQLNAAQAGLDRAALAHALDTLHRSSALESHIRAPEHARFRFTKERELADARQRLESVLGSIGNSTRNLQLLGSLLSTAGQAGMLASAYMGSPSQNVPQAPGGGVPAQPAWLPSGPLYPVR